MCADYIYMFTIHICIFEFLFKGVRENECVCVYVCVCVKERESEIKEGSKFNPSQFVIQTKNLNIL